MKSRPQSSLRDGSRVDMLQSLGGFTVTVNGTSVANTWGSWVQINASTTKRYNWLSITIGNSIASGQTDVVWAMRFAVGGSGSEVEVIPGLLHYSPFHNRQVRNFLIPIDVPEGSRISASLRQDKGLLGTPSLQCMIQGMQAHGVGGRQAERVTSYGTTFSGVATSGTLVDPGAVVATYGAQAILDASTANPIRYMLVNVAAGYNVMANSAWGLDIEKGPTVGGQDVVEGLAFTSHNFDDQMSPPVYNGLYVPTIPPGTRLGARAVSNNTAAASRTFQVQVLGVG